MPSSPTGQPPVHRPHAVWNDVTVIGGGQAGLAMGQALQTTGLTFQILEAHSRVGDAWRQRYDSLVLFTSARRSALPGLPFPGDPERYPTKDEVADYLEGYAQQFALPVHFNMPVTQVRPVAGGFELQTPHGLQFTRTVVVASGPFQTPHVPPFASQLSPEVVQLHSSAYRNPAQLPPGRVMVVGGGNSGAQIAVELTRTHQVSVALGHAPFTLPQRVLGRDLFDVLERLKLLNVPSASRLGRFLRARDPVIGTSLRAEARASRVRLLRRVIKAEGRQLYTDRGEAHLVDAVVWATGFRPDSAWLPPEITDSQGRPQHLEGVSPLPGLMFLGLSWQRSRASALLGGVGNDAAVLAGQLVDVCAKESEVPSAAGSADSAAPCSPRPNRL
ncbi:NAD(P)/FAD-dependent oxidoreductase [Deinococcus sp. QL22]|uniref:flavin-containing monooxygenase n=1 Tax=Deinococcus sp. QL22 TaxID=2939437 RepID=UPI002017E076|nr:NAD(P)/FAD-dependent oxidoreductase [Deinococcus sp. QL22]UQN08130.1 NAD(P)/FAD-dependent oxidoreductase [Deinococcus sp. QL22]